MTAEESKREDDRLFLHIAATRINCLESERHYLQGIHTTLLDQCHSIRSRIEAIERHIKAERASVEELKGGKP